MNSTTLHTAPVVIGAIISLYANLSQPVQAKQYLVLENDILLNQTYNKAVNAVVAAKTEDQPQEAPFVTDKEEIKQQILQVAQHYGINAQQLLNIATCESGLRPNAQNGIYGGLYQFSSATWRTNRNAMGKDPNPDLRFNATEAIETAAFKISHDGTGAWPVCQYR